MTTIALIIEVGDRRASIFGGLASDAARQAFAIQPPSLAVVGTRIDGIVALIIAIGGHMKAPRKARSPYEERGLVFM